MFIFGKNEKGNKNSKVMDSRYVSKLLTEVSGDIIKKGLYTRFGVGFIKLTAEYSTRVARSQLDNDIYLANKLEELVKIRQEDANDAPKSSKENVISLYETLPDLLKTIKTQLYEEEKRLEKLEKSGKEMLDPLNSIIEEMDKLKNEERKTKIQKEERREGLY